MLLGSVSSVNKTAMLRTKYVFPGRTHVHPPTIWASQSMDDKKNDKVFKELGLYSLRKKIEDAVERAEAMTSTALELEEVKRIKQEEIFRGCNLWNDLSTSNESLVALADTIKVVDSLKDLQYKVEEAKLITQLVERDAINHQLFKQAYNSAVDVSKFLDHYEMSKLLRGAFDIQGACLIITAGAESGYSEKWAEKVLGMYTRWAEKQGYSMRVLELLPSRRAGIKSATIEFESEYVYGHLLGEKGLHRMIRYCLDGSIVRETCSTGVDIIPLFLDTAPELDITDEDLEVSSISSLREDQSGCPTETGVTINHLPTGIAVRCSGERSHFVNKTKALNRLKAKLLVAAMEQGISDIRDIKRAAITGAEKQEVRKYVIWPYKLVHDVKTGVQLPDLISVLNGDIEPLIRAHVSLRQGRDMG